MTPRSSTNSWVRHLLVVAIGVTAVAAACTANDDSPDRAGAGGADAAAMGGQGATTGTGAVDGTGAAGTAGAGDAGAAGTDSGECPAGFDLCGDQCVDLADNVAHCGECSNACLPGAGCVAGACSCSEGLTSCESGCTDPTMDSSNCGGCGTVCGGGQSCSGGDCVCPQTQLVCEGNCTDTDTDPAHCGGCNQACDPLQEQCVLGQCECVDGLSRCGDACVDLDSDVAHCGSCTTACSLEQVCSLRTCTTSCAQGLTECNRSCVDIQTSNANCGSCNQACPAGQSCQAGQCTCGEGETDCSGTCVNLSTSIEHCGSCDTRCSGGRQCVSGTCQCPAGTTACGGTCVNLQTSANNCGACGSTCASPGTCVAGQCSCPDGTSDCNGICTSLQTDSANCGSCGNACPTGSCSAGQCPTVKDCVIKTFLTSSQFTNFDNYDGTAALENWTFAYNAPVGEPGSVYAGPYHYSDESGNQLLAMLAGNASTYAINIANSQAANWGGGLGFWTECVDASAYQGVSFWVRGTAPTGMANFAVAMSDTSAPDPVDPAGGGTCLADCTQPNMDIPVTSSWTQMLLSWNSLSPGSANGVSVPASGDNLRGFQLTVPLNWVESSTTPGTYVPSPAAIGLSVDDIRFIEAGTCSGGTTLCGTGCVNPSTNSLHCGRCNNACTGARTCQAGACACPSGYTDCNGECVDTRIDAQNCGACGRPCSGVCSVGVCQASGCTSGMPQVGRTCQASASIGLGKYYISNNQWGASGASGQQCIWSTCQSGNTIGWGTSWTWSGVSNSVKSYASAVLGWHWGWRYSPATTGLPVQLSADRSVTCSWTFRPTTAGTFNVAYDLFAHSIQNPSYTDDPTDEIMVWLNRTGGAGPIGGAQASVNIGGTSWQLHRGSNGYWNVFSFVRTTNTSSATLNLMDFLRDLVNRGWMSSSKYLTSIQAGTEVFTGTGQLDTDSYYCIMQ